MWGECIVPFYLQPTLVDTTRRNNSSIRRLNKKLVKLSHVNNTIINLNVAMVHTQFVEKLNAIRSESQQRWFKRSFMIIDAKTPPTRLVKLCYLWCS